jgi:mycothiol synthase
VITVRPVVTEDDVDAYLAVRVRVHPETPVPRAVFLEDRKRAGQLDLLAERDGEPVGAASVNRFSGSVDGEFAYVTLRVVAERRRLGVGTMLHLRASEHARLLGKTRFYAVVRGDDGDSRGYYAARGYEELGRMQDVELDLATANGEPEVPPGVRLVQAVEEHDRGAWEVALEAEADIPSGEPIRTGEFETWRAREFDGLVSRELSFVALDGESVIGYALLQRFTDDTFQHSMTGVSRAARRRGVALALKQMQIAAARAAGLRYLRAQNDLGNAAMRRINDKLGYRKRYEWVHLGGPLLA